MAKQRVFLGDLNEDVPTPVSSICTDANLSMCVFAPSDQSIDLDASEFESEKSDVKNPVELTAANLPAPSDANLSSFRKELVQRLLKDQEALSSKQRDDGTSSTCDTQAVTESKEQESGASSSSETQAGTESKQQEGGTSSSSETQALTVSKQQESGASSSSETQAGTESKQQESRASASSETQAGTEGKQQESEASSSSETQAGTESKQQESRASSSSETQAIVESKLPDGGTNSSSETQQDGGTNSTCDPLAVTGESISQGHRTSLSRVNKQWKSSSDTVQEHEEVTNTTRSDGGKEMLGRKHDSDGREQHEIDLSRILLDDEEEHEENSDENMEEESCRAVDVTDERCRPDTEQNHLSESNSPQLSQEDARLLLELDKNNKTMMRILRTKPPETDTEWNISETGLLGRIVRSYRDSDVIELSSSSSGSSRKRYPESNSSDSGSKQPRIEESSVYLRVDTATSGGLFPAEVAIVLAPFIYPTKISRLYVSMNFALSLSVGDLSSRIFARETEPVMELMIAMPRSNRDLLLKYYTGNLPVQYQYVAINKKKLWDADYTDSKMTFSGEDEMNKNLWEEVDLNDLPTVEDDDRGCWARRWINNFASCSSALRRHIEENVNGRLESHLSLDAYEEPVVAELRVYVPEGESIHDHAIRQLIGSIIVSSFIHRTRSCNRWMLYHVSCESMLDAIVFITRCNRKELHWCERSQKYYLIPATGNKIFAKLCHPTFLANRRIKTLNRLGNGSGKKKRKSFVRNALRPLLDGWISEAQTSFECLQLVRKIGVCDLDQQLTVRTLMSALKSVKCKPEMLDNDNQGSGFDLEMAQFMCCVDDVGLIEAVAQFIDCPCSTCTPFLYEDKIDDSMPTVVKSQ